MRGRLAKQDSTCLHRGKPAFEKLPAAGNIISSYNMYIVDYI